MVHLGLESQRPANDSIWTVTMPKAPTKTNLRGTDISRTHKLDTTTGRLEPIKKKRPLPQMIAAKKRKRFVRGRRAK